MPVNFIAEVSSNHARDLGRARAFIDAAAEAGCDAVKFQLFRIKEMFAPEILARSAEHRRREAWELPVDFLAPLAAHCRARNIAFACTPFYLDAVRELEPHVAFYKIASYELLWQDLLRAVAETGKPVIISTGMATMPEIRGAVKTLESAGATDISILHCVSAYPTPIEQCNLAAIKTIRDETGCKTGWSDHTADPAVIERAVHRWGAEIIEAHIDLEGAGAEYAAGHCWLARDLAPVIARIRRGESADGHAHKSPTPAELPDREWRADPEDGLRPMHGVRADWAKRRVGEDG